MKITFNLAILLLRFALTASSQLKNNLKAEYKCL